MYILLSQADSFLRYTFFIPPHILNIPSISSLFCDYIHYKISHCIFLSCSLSAFRPQTHPFYVLSSGRNQAINQIEQQVNYSFVCFNLLVLCSSRKFSKSSVLVAISVVCEHVEWFIGSETGLVCVCVCVMT